MLIEMTIKGLVVDSFSSTPIVILKDKAGDKVLSIWVGIYEANAIAQQIENVSMPRPMTHDLLRNLINDLGGRVDRVVVTDPARTRSSPPSISRSRVNRSRSMPARAMRLHWRSAAGRPSWSKSR